MCVWLMILLIPVLVILAGLYRVKKVPDVRRMNEFTKLIWKRYVNKDYPNYGNAVNDDDRQHADGLMAYVERMLDRQINKARGILPFNSIILAVLAIERNHLPFTLQDTELWHRQTLILLFLMMTGLVISSLLCLTLFLFHWGEDDEFTSFPRDIKATNLLVRKRGLAIEWAIIISIACLLVGIVVVAIGEVAGPVKATTLALGKS